MTKLGRGVAAVAVAMAVMATAATAQTVPVKVSAKQQVKDQWNAFLQPGDLVQFMYVNGQIFPPESDGSPHTNNPVLFEARIGHGLIQHPTTVGRFNTTIAKRPAGEIFARVWNTPTLDNPSYYADSQTFAPVQSAVFYPEFGPMTAMDSGDDDNDGLNNSDEADLGSNPDNIDSDGDGVFDFAEFRSGTDLTNDTSYLAMVDILPESVMDDVMMIQWSSVDGYQYQLQYAVEELHTTNLVFYDVNEVVTATGAVSYTFVTNNALESIKSFRVLLVE